MKIFVVFGSKSDETVALPIVEALKKDFDVEYEVISAHRDLEKLQQKMSAWEGDAVVAGAGLAAALPGVVAAMTRVPVFGVCVPAQFSGIDSLASIAQMPPGVPVMTAGPAKPEAIAAFLRHYKASAGRNFSRVHFIMRDKALLSHPDLLADVEKARAAAKERGLDVTLSDAETKDGFNVILVSQAAHVNAEGFCLHVPFFTKDDAQKPATFLKVLEWSNAGGLWLGANNTRNAVHSASRLGAATAISQGRAA